LAELARAQRQSSDAESDAARDRDRQGPSHPLRRLLGDGAGGRAARAVERTGVVHILRRAATVTRKRGRLFFKSRRLLRPKRRPQFDDFPAGLFIEDIKQHLASLEPTATPTLSPTPSPPSGPIEPEKPKVDAGEIARRLQVELKRVECDPISLDGVWGASSERPLSMFNKRTHSSFDVKTASLEAVEAVRARSEVVCRPPVLAHPAPVAAKPSAINPVSPETKRASSFRERPAARRDGRGPRQIWNNVAWRSGRGRPESRISMRIAFVFRERLTAIETAF
jgi:hypothetical protein